MSYHSAPQTATTFAAANAPPEMVYMVHDSVRLAVGRMLLPVIKATLKEINEKVTLRQRPSITGRKRELVERLLTVFDQLREDKEAASYLHALRILEQHWGHEISTNPYADRYGSAHDSVQILGRGQAGPSVVRPSVQTPNGTSSLSGASTYRAELAHHNGVSSAPAPAQAGSFLPSPFYTVKEKIGTPTICQLAHVRPPGAKLIFSLTPAQMADLRTNRSNTQLRLFCTTLKASAASQSGKHPAPIEFPLVCDIRVNREKLSVNVRSKKLPAKVLPPNVNKDGRLNLTNGYNEVELLYQDIRVPYILSLAICSMVTPDALASRVSAENIKSKETVLSEMKRAAEDDDIEVGEVTITLKCPLSYMRLVNPCRGSECAHIQCFDALSFYSVNEQTPSWECPVCSKKVNPASLFIDGYVRDILQRVPDSEEYVNIDADGNWRTPDNKYRSNEADALSAAAGNEEAQKGSTVDSSYSGLADVPKVKGEAIQQGDLSSSVATPPLTPTIQAPASSSTAASRPQNAIEILELGDSLSPPPHAPGSDAIASSSSMAAPPMGVAGPSTAQNGFGRTPSVPNSAPPPAAVFSSPNMSRNASSTRSAGVIDLTLSDSEEEVEVPLRRAVPATSMLTSSSASINNVGSMMSSRSSAAPTFRPTAVPADSVYRHHVTPPTSAPARVVHRFPLDRYLVPRESTSSSSTSATPNGVDPSTRTASAPQIVPLMRGIPTNRPDPPRSSSSSGPLAGSEQGATVTTTSSSSDPAGNQWTRRRSQPPASDDDEGPTPRPHKRMRNAEYGGSAVSAPPPAQPQVADEFDEFGELELAYFDDDFLLDPNAGLGQGSAVANGRSTSSSSTLPATAGDETTADERAGLASMPS